MMLKLIGTESYRETKPKQDSGDLRAGFTKEKESQVGSSTENQQPFRLGGSTAQTGARPYSAAYNGLQIREP